MWYDKSDGVDEWIVDGEYSPLPPVPLTLGAAIDEFNRRKDDDPCKDENGSTMDEVYVPMSEQCSPEMAQA